MKKLKFILLVVTFILFSNCNDKTSENTSHIDICLYESYNLINLLEPLILANKIIRQQELDSIAKIKTGVSVLDKMSAAQAKSNSQINGQGIEYPLFEVLALNITLQNEIKSSAMLGTTRDSAIVLDLLSKADTCFYKNITWKITGQLHNGFKSLYAIKTDKNKIQLNYSDIDSIIVVPTGLNSFGGLAKKIANTKDMSEYWVEVKVKDDFKIQLENRIYTLLMNINSKEFSGSVSNLEKYTIIGLMNNDDFQILNSKFENIIKIKDEL